MERNKAVVLPRELSSRTLRRRINRQVEKVIAHQGLATARPFLFLHGLNLLLKNPIIADNEILQDFVNYRGLLEQEFVARDNPRVLSIGTEIEIQRDFLPRSDAEYSKTLDLLQKAGLGVILEPTVNFPTELRIPPTYSAKMQAAIIQELEAFGLLPGMDKFASLHINLA